MNPRIALCIALAVVLGGCSQAERPVEPHAASPPAPEPTPRKPAPQPATPPTQPQPATTKQQSTPPAPPPAKPEQHEPEQPAPAEQTVETPQELPAYLKLIRRIDPTRDATLEPHLRSPRTVELTTANVRRFRISRFALPMRASGSLVLRVDRQVFEWTSNRPTVEFVLQPASGWVVVNSDGSGP